MWLNLLRSPLTWLLLALAIACTVAMAGWGWAATSAATAKGQVTTLQSDLKAADDKANEAQRREQGKDSTINTLKTELDTQATAAAELQSQLGDLSMTAATRAETIKRLKRENAELRTWADRPLPAPVIRLLKRPAITGAADYQAHLSGPDPLPAATGQPNQ
ncbi:Rz-like lysis system protein LysB [Aeromonas salmonicida]|uniref:Rz-like lysis system protein LysB n=1 Tax=Aeromonas salmonicida TaxID=645 RepID=UPI000731A704|nr:Rz-like lysis system protein LysB [Aeromonas salmonicida]KTA92486.1 LysB [Aeromonas salmonicida subsp. smithia]TNI74068.1 phage lysis regulatory protein LysB [Aeromonas salmonicida]